MSIGVYVMYIYIIDFLIYASFFVEKQTYSGPLNIQAEIAEVKRVSGTFTMFKY